AHGFLVARALDRVLDRAGDARVQRMVAADADVDARVHHGAALADQDLAGARALAAVGLDAQPLCVGVAPVARAAACFLVCHGGFSLVCLTVAQAPTISSMRTSVKPCRWPWVLAKCLRRRSLKMRIFSPRPCATTVALTAAPSTNGAPTRTPSPSPSIKTRSTDTVAPTSAASSSTFTCSPDFTRYCLPPVWITAYMAGLPVKLRCKHLRL